MSQIVDPFLSVRQKLLDEIAKLRNGSLDYEAVDAIRRNDTTRIQKLREQIKIEDRVEAVLADIKGIFDRIWPTVDGSTEDKTPKKPVNKLPSKGRPPSAPCDEDDDDDEDDC